MRLQTPIFFYALFGLSGFSGLIYESIWTHYLKLFLGHAAYAQTLVLAIFMGGMALGAWGAARRELRNPLLAYALVEGVIGLFAVLFHPLFVGLTGFSYEVILPVLGEGWNLYKWGLAAALILPQSILLGATFPLMSAGILRAFPHHPGQHLSLLYFSNSLGAALGVLVSGFVLIAWVGLPGTIVFAGMINLFLAWIVWRICQTHLTTSTSPAHAPSTAQAHDKLFYGILAIAAFTGLASFFYEIAWIRMLTLVLGASTHAFELMLSAFILGLALGGLWIRKRIDRIAQPLHFLAWVQVIMGLLALATIPLYRHTFYAMSWALEALQRNEAGYVWFNGFSHALALLVMLPATLCAGMTLPLITYILLRQGHGERAIGWVYSANTLGSILGVVLAVQWVMPLLGMKSVVIFGSVVDVGLGLGLLWMVSKSRFIAASAVAACALTCVVVFFPFDPLLTSSGVFRHGNLRPSQGWQVLFHQDGKTATVDVLYNPRTKNTTLITNGKPDASIGQLQPSPDEVTMSLLAALPLSVHPAPQKVANIGLGSGMTTHVLLGHKQLQQVDTVEIEPAIVRGAQAFGERVARVYSEPRSHIYLEDAKTFFTNRQQKYDIIISEPSNPWVSGVAGLFSVEYYRLVQGYLQSDGIFAQWLHLYEINMDLTASVLKAIGEVFADYALYHADENNLIVLAVKNGQVPLPHPGIFAQAEIKTDLAYVGIASLADLQIRLLGNQHALRPLLASYPIAANSDYFPVLDLAAVKARFLESHVMALINQRWQVLPVMTLLTPNVPSVALNQLGDNAYLPWADSIHDANAMYARFFPDASTQPPPDISDPRLLAVTRAMLGLRYQCQPSELERAWLPQFQVFAGATLPFLPQEAVSKLWTALEQAPCAAQFPPLVSAWLEFYRALYEKNWDKVSAYATQLLSQEEKQSSEHFELLLTAYMMAQLTMDKPHKALAYWYDYPLRDNPPLMLRLLASTALQRSQQPMP